MNCALACIDPRNAPTYWPLAEKLISAAACKQNLSDFAALTNDVLHGRALLWLVGDIDQHYRIRAAVVTQIIGSNANKYCTIVACGGEGRRDWLPLLGQIEDYAKREGCAAMRIYGRRGWARVLPDYKIIGHITERALT